MRTLEATEIMPGLFRATCPDCSLHHYLTALGHQYGLCPHPTPFRDEGAILVRTSGEDHEEPA